MFEIVAVKRLLGTVYLVGVNSMDFCLKYTIYSYLPPVSFADAPEIQVEKNWVHSGENAEAELVCIVNAEPAAEVSFKYLQVLYKLTENMNLMKIFYICLC